MSRNSRLALLGLAVIVIVVAAVAIGSGGGGSTHYSGHAVVRVVGARAQGGIAQLHYKRGQTVDLTIDSDTADEIHIHGYDLHKDVARGGSAHFSFPASITGVFVIELEKRAQQIASLQVTP